MYRVKLTFSISFDETETAVLNWSFMKMFGLKIENEEKKTVFKYEWA